MWLRRIARTAAWAMALAGLALLVVAWRCRTDVRLLWVRTKDHIGYAQVTPRHVDLAYWRRAEYDASVRRKPLWSPGRIQILTTTEPTPSEPATTSEKIADAAKEWHLAGFGFVRGNSFWPMTPSQREVWVPTWFVVVVAFSPLLVTWTVGRRRGSNKQIAAAQPVL